MLSNYICGLDISSSKIAASIAKIKKKRIADIFFETLPIKGIKRGIIVDSVELINCISRLLKNLKSKSGINIKFVYTNISGLDIVTKHSHAIMPLAERGNKVITLSDIDKINEQARILGSSLEEEVIHSIPFSYTIDSKTNVINPLGLYSHKLEVDLYLVCSKSSSIQNLNRVINQAGYEIEDLFFSGIATSEVVFSEELKKGINVLCDIGCDITELSVFRDGILIHIEILPIGGDDLTKELKENLKIPFDLAEDIKMSYATIGDYPKINQDREILIKKNNDYKPIKQRMVCEIITSKTKLICQSIRDALEKSKSFDNVNNFITTGKTLLLEGFLEMLENILGIPIKLGRITEPDIISLIDKDNTLKGPRYLTYITSLGIICRALHEKYSRNLYSQKPTRNSILKIIDKFKEIYQEYF